MKKHIKHKVREALILFAFYVVSITTTFAQDAKSYYSEGLEKASDGNYEEAISLFNKTIALNPNHYMARLDKGRSELTIKSFKEALADFDQAIKLDSRYPGGWFLRGVAKYNLKDYDGALADYTHAISLDTNNTWSYYDRGLAYEALNKMDAACTEYKKALKLGLTIAKQKVNVCNGTSKDADKPHSGSRDPEAESYFVEACEKETVGNFEEAIRLFDKAIDLKENYFLARFHRGYCNSMLGLYKEAIADYDEAIKLNPKFKESWYNRGLVKQKSGDYTGAIADYTQVISIDSKHPDVYYNRAIAYDALGKQDSACIDYQTSAGLGFKEAKAYADHCNSQSKTGLRTEILDTNGDSVRLSAVGVVSVPLGGDMAYGIIFEIMPAKINPSELTISVNEDLKQNPFASIDMQLKNGSSIQTKIVLTGQDESDDKPILFMGVFNEDDKALMLGNDVEKINIYSGKKSYEYTIKDSYAGKIKLILSSNASN